MIFCVLEIIILYLEPSNVFNVVPLSSRKCTLIFASNTPIYSGGTTLLLSKITISFNDCNTVLSGAKTNAL